MSSDYQIRLASAHKALDDCKINTASVLGSYVKWDINKALELCADILEDVNAHKESAAVRKMMEEE